MKKIITLVLVGLLAIWTHGVLVGGRDVERDASPAFIKVPAVK